MACERFAGELKAHAAGADPSQRLRAHLDGCPACREGLARERGLVARIDRDLAEALRIEPSVEFKARVREHIAENPAKAGSHILARSAHLFVGSGFSRISGLVPTWRFALGAVSLVLVAGLAITLVLRTGTSRETPASTTSRTKAPATTPSVAHQDALVVGQAPARVATNDAHPRAVHGHPVIVAGRLPTTDYRLPPRPKAEPEVLVPPDQRIALNRLLEMIRTGKIDERMFPAAPQEDMAGPPAQVVAPIVVQELKVPPIDVAATGSTEKRQNR